MIIKAFKDTFGSYAGLVLGYLGNNDTEFVAAITERPVNVFSDAMFNDATHKFEDLVTFEMAELIIHLLEIVYVDYGQVQVMILAVSPLGLFYYLGIEMTAVIESCQAI